MEGRMAKYRQVSPERAKVRRGRSPKEVVQKCKVGVVYYLTRNRQLEHPHFIEVTVSSSQGLYLRDVIERLNALRGSGMTSLYSWSSKRNYKNGFVWHDLCEDDLILPVQGNEYVLKGSEIVEDSSAGRFSPATTRSQSEAFPCSVLNGSKDRGEVEISPPQRSGSSGISPDSRIGNNSPRDALTEYKAHNEGATDASTQVEESDRKGKPRKTCNRGVSTDDGMLEAECSREFQNREKFSKTNSGIGFASSPLSSSPADSLPHRKTETLESLTRADLSKIGSSRIYEDGFVRMSPSTKTKASSMLMQLISCGSISVKYHSLDLIPSYDLNLSGPTFSSPLFSTSVMLGDLDCLSGNHRLLDFKLEDKEYFSGSLIDTKIFKAGIDGCASLKRSSSYNSERTIKHLGSVHEEVIKDQSKRIVHAIKASLVKQPRSEPMRSPISGKPRISGDRLHGSHAATNDSPVVMVGSARMIEPPYGKKLPKESDSFGEDLEKTIKIEERLASGARVIIQSKEC